MDSLKQFFSFMNDISFPYVVLRNWDGLPYDFNLGEHSDLDLLVYDFEHWKEIFPDAKPEYEYPRVRMKVPIEDSYLYVDVRHVGDGYYPEDFERGILDTREWNMRGFYTPSPLMHRIALAYHAVHHKNYIAKEYYRWLGDVTIQDLFDALKQGNVGWETPKDKSVGAFNPYWKGATSVVASEGDKIIKEQTGYLSYDLITNEYEKLNGTDSKHFPKVYAINGKTITMENCGVPLENDIPYNWKEQLFEIVSDLERYHIIHRDIKLDNLMVKDGIIKLIDFGWAVFQDENEQKEPPSCLGYPNRPSYGFDDKFSMKMVIKQLEYILEEKGIGA